MLLLSHPSCAQTDESSRKQKPTFLSVDSCVDKSLKLIINFETDKKVKITTFNKVICQCVIVLFTKRSINLKNLTYRKIYIFKKYRAVNFGTWVYA
jgi:hypothetical protein